MNWIDRFISAVSPEDAVRRAFARSQLERLQKIGQRSGYDGAKIGGRTVWDSGSGSANQEIGDSLKKLQSRSRDLVRNNPYAARAITSLAGNAVGTGFTLKLPKPVAPWWSAWCEYADADGQLDFAGLCSLGARTIFESGEVLIRTRIRPPEDGFEIPLQLQILETDYLDTTKNQQLAGGGWIWGGIEFDAIGRRKGYWFFPRHPGEVATFRAHSMTSSRVDAQFVQHIYEKQRPGQWRGVPRFAASMMRLRDLDDYEEAELVRKGYEACYMAIIFGKEGQTPLGPATVDPGTGKRVETMTAGMIAYMDDTQDVKFGQPAAMGGYGEYTKSHLHAIAAGAGVTYDQMTGDLSDVNFSSLRAGMIEYRRHMEVFQWLTFVPMFLNPILRTWEKHARIAGKIQSKEPLPALWTPPKWDWVDPVKEVAATRDEVAGGLASLSEKLRARGYDPAIVFAEIGDDVKALSKAANIPAEIVFQILFQAGKVAAPASAAPLPE